MVWVEALVDHCRREEFPAIFKAIMTLDGYLRWKISYYPHADGADRVAFAKRITPRDAGK